MYQNLTIVGNIGRDPEQGKGEHVMFSVAVNRTYTGTDGEPHEETTWFPCSAFGSLGRSVLKYVKKGMLVLVEGHIRTYKDNEDVQRWSVNARNVRFLSKPASSDDTTEEDDDEWMV